MNSASIRKGGIYVRHSQCDALITATQHATRQIFTILKSQLIQPHMTWSRSLVLGCVLLLNVPLALAVEMSTTNGYLPEKWTLGYFRVSDEQGRSYWYSNLSAQYRVQSFKLKASLPHIQRENGDSGIGNGLLKLSWMNQWQQVFVDFHLRQRLATAAKRVTLPVHDQGLSLELSGRIGRGIWFTEVGYWWREKTRFDRKNTGSLALGGIIALSRSWIIGSVIDHKPSALGQIDQTFSALTQYRWTQRQKTMLYVGKGLTADSPDWITGLQWQYRY